MPFAAIDNEGFAFVPGILSESERRGLLGTLGAMTGAGQRGVLGIPEVAHVASSARLLALVAPHTSAEPRVVRAIYFNKSPEANWAVAWHQDLTVAVRERMDVDGFGPWSVKDGVAHAHAPAEVLKQMLTIRLHLE